MFASKIDTSEKSKPDYVELTQVVNTAQSTEKKTFNVNSLAETLFMSNVPVASVSAVKRTLEKTKQVLPSSFSCLTGLTEGFGYYTQSICSFFGTKPTAETQQLSERLLAPESDAQSSSSTENQTSSDMTSTVPYSALQS